MQRAIIRTFFRQKPAVSLEDEEEDDEKPIPKVLGLIGSPIPQIGSAFLTKLPLELRQIVYEHVYESSVIHVGELDHRLAHVCCTLDAPACFSPMRFVPPILS